MLIHLYSAHIDPNQTPDTVKLGAHRDRPLPPLPNGHARGHGPSASERQMRDAEEFELEALMSEDDDVEAKGGANGRV